MNEEDSFWSLVPLLTTRNKLCHERLDNSGQESHAFHQPIFSSMTDERILIIKEVEHAEQTYLVEFHELFIDVEKVFIFITSEPPKMGESLDGSLFIRCAVGTERSFYSVSKLIREVFAEANNKIDDLGVHVRKIKQ